MPTQAPTGSTSRSRAATGLARRGLDRDDPLVDLGHFLREELREEVDRGAREHDLSALGVVVDVEHVGADAVAGAVVLARHLLLDREHRLRPAEVDDQGALLEAPHDAVHDLALAVLVLVEDDVALGVANALDDHLLGGLREDAAEVGGVELDADLVADLGVRVELARAVEDDLRGRVRDPLDDLAKLEQLDLGGLAVEAGLDLLLLPELLAGRLDHRLFEGADDGLAVDAFVLRELLDLSLERCDVHGSSKSGLATGASGALCEVVAREFVDGARLRYVVEVDRNLGPVHRHARHPRVEGEQAPAEAPPPVERRAGLEPDLPAAGPDEVLLAREHAVEPGRGDLELVADRNRVRRVQLRRDLARHVGAALDRHQAVAARRVHDHPKRPRRPALVMLDIHQLQSVIRDDGLDQGSHVFRNVPIHVSPTFGPKRMKWTGGPLLPIDQSRRNLSESLRIDKLVGVRAPRGTATALRARPQPPRRRSRLIAMASIPPG
jgi:hypothetical protein